MTRSVLIPEATAATKDNGMFRNKKRLNEDAREHMHGSIHNSEVLTKTHGRQEELKNVDEKEILHCQHVLSIKNHYKNQRHADALQKQIAKCNTNKIENASMKIRGIDYVPLLVGQVQVGKVTSTQRELLIEEIHMRGTQRR